MNKYTKKFLIMKKLKKVLYAPIILGLLMITIPTISAEITQRFETGWQMIALPYQPAGAISVCERFAARDIYGVDGTRFLECGVLGEWKPGRGVWAYIEEPLELTIGGNPIRDDVPFEMDLQPGWNIIGNPFLYSISINGGIYVDGVPIGTSDSVRPEIYGYDPAENKYEVVDTLDPWRGYLVYAKRAARLKAKSVRAPEKPGPIATMRIVDTNGRTTEDLDIEPGEEVTLKAAGYDAKGRFVKYLDADWSAVGGITISGITSDSIKIKSSESGLTGLIKAVAGALTDETGRITILGSGDLYEYPFDETTRIIKDAVSGLAEVAGQTIAAFRDGITADEVKVLVEGFGGTLIGSNTAAGLFQIKTPAGTDINTFRNKLAKAAGVSAVSPNYILTAGGFPNDADFAGGAIADRRWAYENIGMDEVWGSVVPSGAPVIGLIDTGIDTSHPELAGRIAGGRNFLDPAAPDDVTDDSGHGTAVAGVIASAADNGIGIAGVCPTCRIMPLKACNGAGACPAFSVANAIPYAADNGARVINLSLGAYLNGGEPAIDLLRLVVNDAATKGALLVGAAGNDNTDSSNYYPAGFVNVLSVAATNENDNRASFSNYGAKIQIAAPGANIYTTLPQSMGGYGYRQGTSLAAGYVTGVAGLLFAMQPSMTAQSVQSLIQATLQSVASDKPISGRIDASQLVQFVKNFNNPPVLSRITPSGAVGMSGGKVNLHAECSDPDGDLLTYIWSADSGTVAGGGADAVWTLPAQRGGFEARVTVTDSFGNIVTGKVSVIVLNGALKMVQVTPAELNIKAGEVVHYEAGCIDDTAFSGGGLPVPCGSAAEWRLIGGVGTLDAHGGFAATAAGTGYVHATVNGVDGYTKVNVLDANGISLHVAAANTPCDGTWSRERCNNDSTNEFPGTLYSKLTRKWARSFVFGFNGQAIAKNGMIYAGDKGGSVQCFNQLNGTDCPGFPVSVGGQFVNSGAFSTTDADGGAFIYIANENGTLYKIPTTGGMPTWSYTPPNGPHAFYTSPAVKYDSGLGMDVIYIASAMDGGVASKGRVYAIKGDGSDLVWAYPPVGGVSPVTGFGYGSPVYANVGGTDMVFAANGNIVVLNQSNGNLIRTIDCGNKCLVSPNIAEYGGNVYVYSSVGTGFSKFDPTTGNELWRAPTKYIWCSAAYKNNVFYVGTYDQSGEVYAIHDLGNGPFDYNIDWTAVTSKKGKMDFAPTVYNGGLFYTNYNSPSLGTIDINSGTVLWELATNNITYSGIIMTNPITAEPEVYLGDNNGLFYALERNYPPVITSFYLEPKDELSQTIDPGAQANAYLDATDLNGLTDLDYAEINLVPVGGGLHTLIQMSNGTGHFETVAPTSNITVPLGTAPGTYTLEAKVIDKGGLESVVSSDKLIVSNMSPSIISAGFTPAYIYPNGVETTTISVTVEDKNNTLGASGYVRVNLAPLRGGTTTWQTLTSCTAFDATNRMTCTGSVTADVGTAFSPPSYNLAVEVYDGQNTGNGTTSNLSVVNVGSYGLTPDVTSLTTGATSTVTIKAYYPAGPQINSYNNVGNPINITIVSGSTGNGIEYASGQAGTTVTDLYHGNATIGAGSFVAGAAKIKISNTKVESNVTIKATDSTYGKTGTSNPGISWAVGAAHHVDLTLTSGYLVTGNWASIKATVYDQYNNKKTDFTNPNGFNLSTSTPCSGTLTYGDPAQVTDGGNGCTGVFNTGGFAGGEATFKVKNMTAETVKFSATEKAPGTVTTLNSDDVTWNGGVLDHFDLTVTLDPSDPSTTGNPTAGYVTEIQITAHDASHNVITYNNTTNIDLAITSGTGSTVTWSNGAWVTNNPGTGTGTLAPGHFSGGSVKVYITDTKAEITNILITEHDAGGKTGTITGSDIKWIPGPLEHFDVDVTSASSVIVGNPITFNITAKDQHGNTITTFANPNKVKLTSTASPATGITWGGAGVVNDMPAPDQGEISGSFTNGVFTGAQVTNSLISSGVNIIASEEGTSVTTTSPPTVNWTPGPMKEFGVSAQPGPFPANTTSNVTVKAYDTLGNVKTDYNGNARVYVKSGYSTTTTITWAGADVTSAPAGTGYAIIKLTNGQATGITVADKKAEGPVVIGIEDSVTAGLYASESRTLPAAAESPTWVAGPLAKIKIRDAANNGGSEVGTRTMAAGDTLNVYAAGYDAYDNFRQDESSTWTTIPISGSFDSIPAGPAASNSFTPITEYTSGIIRAVSVTGGYTDDTGTISVLSSKPAAPVLSATGNVGKVSLSWTAVTKMEDGTSLNPANIRYKIWRSTTPGVNTSGPPLYTTTAAGEITYDDTTVTTWTTYYYVAKAFLTTTGVESNNSNEVSAASIRTPLATGNSCPYHDPNVYYPPNTPGLVNRPGDLALGGNSPAGVYYIYVADTDNNRLSVFDENCNFYYTLGSYGFSDGKYLKPTGILYDGGGSNGGNLMVADASERIQMVKSTDGTALSFATASKPWKIEWAGAGGGSNVLVASVSNYIYTVDMVAKKVVSSFYATGARGVVFNPSNNLIYVSDAYNNIVRAFDTSGNEQTSMKLGLGTGSAYGYLKVPQDLAVDTAGNVYVADSGNNRVQIFKTDGTLLNVVGAGTLTNPLGLGLSPDMTKLWVIDFYNQRFTGFEIPPSGP